MGWMIFAFCWGLAEATLFFILPDVLLTILAVKNGKQAIWACLGALVGAILGGTLMYLWGLSNPQTALDIVEKVPAINSEMIQEVQESVREEGLFAMALGPVKGIPYKIYAVEAARQGIPYLSFFLVSIPARLVRFLLTSVLAWTIAKYVLKNESLQSKYWILAGVWILVYLFYFSLNPS